MAVVAVVGACSSSTDPGGETGELTLTYHPSSDAVALNAGGVQDFWVTVSGAGDYEVVWSGRDGVLAETDSLHYEATQVGVDTVQVVFSGEGKVLSRAWRVVISTDDSKLPGTVTGLAASHGEEPVTADLSWQGAVATFYPVAGYEIAVSYAGEIYDWNWDEATPVATVSHDEGTVRQSVILNSADHGLRPGERVWFGVRARDDHGQVGRAGEGTSLLVSSPWYLEVAVHDDAGRPMQSVVLDVFAADATGDDDPVDQGATDAQGVATFGPYSDADAYMVLTKSSDGPAAAGDEPGAWFDFLSTPHGAGDGPLTITLIGRYVLTLEPCSVGETPIVDFLSFLRKMTRTVPPVGGRATDPEYLYGWSDFPVAVFVPSHMYEDAANGIAPFDLKPFVLAGLDLWNEAMGETYLVPVASEAEAQIVVDYDASIGSTVAGVATQIEPPGLLGDVIPELRGLTINPPVALAEGNPVTYPYTEFLMGVATHEFGHLLGFYDAGHICLTYQHHLMDGGGAQHFLDFPAAVDLFHDEETRLVRAMRFLVQGVDMNRYMEQLPQ